MFVMIGRSAVGGWGFSVRGRASRFTRHMLVCTPEGGPCKGAPLNSNGVAQALEELLALTSAQRGRPQSKAPASLSTGEASRRSRYRRVSGTPQGVAVAAPGGEHRAHRCAHSVWPPNHT